MASTTSTDVALMLLQLIALTIPPAVVLIDQLRRTQNLEWTVRKLSFGLVFSSVTLLLGGAVAVLLYFLTVSLPITLIAGLLLVLLGLLPLGAFVLVLYREHRKEHGP
ncbi:MULTISPECIES: hypothetical protein [Natrialba]|uniref:Uncharacterized protein n=1 Tax=Natrialba aegyptia DSM 13077 TaxID=1227491 RepID=M0BAS0_9EURY|nr:MULTISPECIES: hypothetical protein [Natrialba]ELZ07398.1 hypothetical protein C480_05061 [Natrialba aegyptia DSM 13077]